MTTQHEITLAELEDNLIPADECELLDAARKYVPEFVIKAATRAVKASGAEGFALITGFSQLDTEDKYTMADMLKFMERRRDPRMGLKMLAFIRENKSGICYYDRHLQFPACIPYLDMFNLHLERGTVWMVQTYETTPGKYLIHLFKLGLKGN